MNVETERDFGSLPVVAWVRILEHLSITDRYHASLTCSTVYQAFGHPALWRSVTLSVRGKPGICKGAPLSVEVPDRNFHLVRKFGKFFHDARFYVGAPLDKSFGEWNTVLSENVKGFNVRKLTFDVGGLRNISGVGAMKPLTENMKPMVELVRNSAHLKSLIISSWPVFPSSLNNPEENVFQAAIDNAKITELTNLSLFRCDSVRWSKRRPFLLPVSLTEKMVERFKSITHLALRSPMLSENLIACLSHDGRQRLQQLNITVQFIPENERFQIPKIRDSVWRGFSMYNTNVRVHVLVLSRVPHFTLEQFLRPSCPLYSIRFGCFVRCDKEFVAYMAAADGISSSLETFEYYEEDGDFEKELFSLAENSNKLCRLIYYGKISVGHVIQLAELRGTEWQEFRLMRKNIYMAQKRGTEPVTNEDTVIAKNSSGEYVLVDMLKFHEQIGITSNEDEEQKMIDRVSQKLGSEWFPESDTSE